ncbi:erythromycin esterase family protein [Kocuria aegyptia]|uniref:Protein-L-isoaspartate O-methyltransferase n=1 Tax=Kocuria aegyptia TaxID=330943 RepID=A0ABP4WLN1_9MICC
MTPVGQSESSGSGVLDEIRSLASPLGGAEDLDRLVEQAAVARFVCVGEASHGTHEFYARRADLSRRLIQEHGFTWIGVEADWPDCWRINRWVRGQADQGLDARGVLETFKRWPTWMWANEEVAGFLDWLHQWNAGRPAGDQVGFYGLDVYSLWDSLREIRTWVQANAPDALPAAEQAWQCFTPYGEDPHEYAWSTRIVPETCEADVVALLAEVRRRTLDRAGQDPEALDAALNAMAAADAEHYYRTMVGGDQQSWNVRDTHMADVVDLLAEHHGSGSKGLVWEHNTHVGDARATDMARYGLVNVGQLVRERHAAEGVVLVGLASHRGTVIAAGAWGDPEETMAVPEARPGSHEDALHEALGEPAVLVFGPDRSGPWLSRRAGHRAIGVVYSSWEDAGNYVPTVMGGRYDALLWFEDTSALRPLHHERPPEEPEFETEPTGF